MAYPNISNADKNLLERFLVKVSVVPLDMNNLPLIDKAAELRKLYRLKLPDAVIAATALHFDCQLVSNDKELAKVPDLTLIRF